MKIYLTKKYLAVLGLLTFLTVFSYLSEWESWITVSLIGFILIYFGHEWIHVIVAQGSGVNIEYLVFEIRGDCGAFFYPSDPETEAKIYLAGAGWDIFISLVIAAVAITEALNTWAVMPFLFGAVIVFALVLSLNTPECDFQEYLKRVKSEP